MTNASARRTPRDVSTSTEPSGANGGPHFYVFLYVDSGSASGSRECHAQVSGIEAGFVHPDRRVVADKQGSTGAQRHALAGELFYGFQVSGVELFAQRGQRGQFCGMFGVVGGKHAGGGPGRLRHNPSFFKHADTMAAAGQFQGDGEADDSSARDNDVLSPHSSIVG